MYKSKNSALKVARNALLALAMSSAVARADVVQDWNRIAVETVLSQEKIPARAARNVATAHIAMFEAMNFVEGAYVARFLIQPPKPASMSSHAAAASAAHRVLSEAYPDSKQALDAALQSSLLALPGGQEHRGSAETGRQLGAIIHAVRGSEQPADLPFEGTQAGDSTRDAVAWTAVVARYVAAARLKPIEGARLYALVALAVGEADVISRDLRAQAGVEHPCVSCMVNAALEVILAAQPGFERKSGVALASIGTLPVLPSANPRLIDDATGSRIGREALVHYAPAR